MTDVATVDPDELYNERIDRAIWRGIGVKSVRDIAKETGLTPEQVLRRKSELIDAVDVLTVQQKRTKLLIDLERIAQDSWERAEAADDEFFSGMMNSSVAAMKTVLVELNRVSKQEDTALARLNDLRMREILRLIDTAVANTLGEIAVTYELDSEKLQEVFQSHLRPAAEGLEA